MEQKYIHTHVYLLSKGCVLQTYKIDKNSNINIKQEGLLYRFINVSADIQILAME